MNLFLFLCCQMGREYFGKQEAMDDVEDGRYRRIRAKHARLLAADIFGQMEATEKNKGPSAAELVSVQDREEDTIFLPLSSRGVLVRVIPTAQLYF